MGYELLPNFGCFGGKAFDLGGAQLIEPRPLDGIERRTRFPCVERFSLEGDWASGRKILRDRGDENRRPFERKSLRRSADAVDDRAFEQLTTRANHQPAESGKPAPLVKSLQ